MNAAHNRMQDLYVSITLMNKQIQLCIYQLVFVCSFICIHWLLNLVDIVRCKQYAFDNPWVELFRGAAAAFSTAKIGDRMPRSNMEEQILGSYVIH